MILNSVSGISGEDQSHVVFEGDFWGEIVAEFSHSLGRVEMWRGGFRFGVVCNRPFRLAVP